MNNYTVKLQTHIQKNFKYFYNLKIILLILNNFKKNQLFYFIFFFKEGGGGSVWSYGYKTAPKSKTLLLEVTVRDGKQVE